MNNLLMDLKQHIGSEKTLIISGTQFGGSKYLLSETIIVHLVAGSRLQKFDLLERDMIQFYVDQQDCSQVLFVGSYDPALLKQLQEEESPQSLRSALKFNLTILLRHKYDRIVCQDIAAQMLIELNVINQCSLLMDYFFIKKKVEANTLQLKGLVTGMKAGPLKPVFYNGIVYNDILTSN
jgi:hypothetical protein